MINARLSEIGLIQFFNDFIIGLVEISFQFSSIQLIKAFDGVLPLFRKKGSRIKNQVKRKYQKRLIMPLLFKFVLSTKYSRCNTFCDTSGNFRIHELRSPDL